jgi:hypothetical protein
MPPKHTRPHPQVDLIHRQTASSGTGTYSIWKATTYVEPAEWPYDVLVANGSVIRVRDRRRRRSAPVTQVALPRHEGAARAASGRPAFPTSPSHSFRRRLACRRGHARSSCFGASATITAVVSNRPATDAAFCSASRVTKSYLAGQGIGSMRLSAAGKGESHPVAGNDSASGRQQNRRVEVIISNPPAAGALLEVAVRTAVSKGGSGATECYLSDCTPGTPNPKCARTFATT